MMVKLPYGLTKVCREKKLLTLVKFWYKLKTQAKNGCLVKGSLIHVSDESLSQIYSKLKKLQQLGLLRPYKKGYLICSYDSLWKYLGYSYSFKRKGEKRERRNNFRILKVPSSELDYAWDELDRLLIFDSLKKQEKAISTVKASMPKYTQEYVNGSLNHVYSVIIAGTIEEKAISALNLFQLNNVNQDVTLSSKGVSKVLGYRSSYSGYTHLQKFYNPVLRCIKICSEWNDFFGKETAKQLRSKFHKPFFYDKMSGGVYLRISSLI